MLLSFSVIAPHTVSEQQVLTPRAYLDLMSRQAQPVREHEVQHRAEILARRQGEEWYVPDTTLTNGWENETRRDPNKTEQRGLTSNLDTVWSTLLGTEVSLGLQYQYGEQSSAVPTGLPEDFQENQQLSLEVQQPILRGFSVAHNRIPIELAREGWGQYQNQGSLTQLEIQQQALRHLIELQRLADRVQIEQELANHLAALLATTEVLRLEGQSTELDVQLAQLDLQEQQSAVELAHSAYRQQQRTMVRPLLQPQLMRIEPLGSMVQLLEWLQPAEQAEPNFETHPEWLISQSEARSAVLSAQRNQRDHWPDINLFFRFEKDFRENLPDQEAETFGIRLSYTFYDLATREQQRRASAARDTARWQQEEAWHRLRTDYQRLQENIQAARGDIELLITGLSLSERALSQELERYEMGFASLLDVERRQDDRLNRALNLLEARGRLASGLAESFYLTHRDIRSWL